MCVCVYISLQGKKEVGSAMIITFHVHVSKSIILKSKTDHLKKKVTIFAMITSASFSNEIATSSKIGASFLQCPHQGA